MQTSSWAQRNPRLAGVAIVFFGLVCLGINVWTLRSSQHFYGKLMLLGCALVPSGVWVSATGIVQPPRGAPPPPLWWTIGLGLFAALGFAAGAYLVFGVLT